MGSGSGAGGGGAGTMAGATLCAAACAFCTRLFTCALALLTVDFTAVVAFDAVLAAFFATFFAGFFGEAFFAAFLTALAAFFTAFFAEVDARLAEAEARFTVIFFFAAFLAGFLAAFFGAFFEAFFAAFFFTAISRSPLDSSRLRRWNLPAKKRSSRRWDFRRLAVKVNLRRAAKHACACVLLAASATAVADDESPSCERGWRLVGTFPHDPRNFTQGLAIRDGVLYESTGHYGASTVQRKELRTGKVLSRRELPADLFGEGLTRVGARLYQLTWKEEVGTVYDLDLKPVASFRYAGEGWGAATLSTLAGERLVLGDGSHRLRMVDPETMAPDWSIEVRDLGQPVDKLNELEVVNGEILANVWMSDRVAAIDPYTGRVKGWYDLSPLRQQLARLSPRNDVLNGLALDPDTGHVFATGKNWPALFELQLFGCQAAQQ